MERFKVTSAEQVQALTSPLRSEIVRLCQGSPRSVAEMASALCRSAASLHYHVRHLEEIGLLRQTGKRSIGPRSERMYEAVSKQIEFSSVSKSQPYREAIRKKTRSVISKISREYEAAYAAERQVILMRGEGRLTPDTLKRARQLVGELNELLSNSGDDGEPYSLTAFLLPLSTQ